MTLRTERDVIETLSGTGAITLDQLYAACEKAGVTGRDNGANPIPAHGGDQVWRRRVRSGLQALKAAGRAERVGDATWVIDGTPAAPQRMLLVIAGEPSHLELALADAETLLAETDEPVDLVLADPPWALGISDSTYTTAARDRLYVRDDTTVVGGYVDINPACFAEVTQRWMTAATGVLRPGAYLCVITGPAQAARAQVTAEDLGLHFVNQVIIRRRFALATTRRFSHAHSVATIVCAGSPDSRRRHFACPPGLPLSRAGRPYPTDVWDPPRADRIGRVKYPAMLNPAATRQLVQALTVGPDTGADAWTDLVVDPFVGGGATAVACWETKRRFRGGDINPRALALTAARLLDEHIAPTAADPARVSA